MPSPDAIGSMHWKKNSESMRTKGAPILDPVAWSLVIVGPPFFDVAFKFLNDTDFRYMYIVTMITDRSKAAELKRDFNLNRNTVCHILRGTS